MFDMKSWRVGDIETLAGGFLYHDCDLRTGEEHTFRIDPYVNQLTDLVQYLQSEDIEYFVFFNGLSFDAQVLQYILDNWTFWAEYYNGYETAATIAQFGQDVIHDTNHGVFPPYREWKLWKKQIDPFKIHHYDNKARRCSLKWLEFSMDLENIEEMPIHHTRKDLTPEEIEEIISYCKNDVRAARELLLITMGETEFEEYKGKNKIQDRLDVIKEFKLRDSAMNYSDVKIGDELNKIGYAKERGISTKDIYDLKANRKPTGHFTFADCIPDYVEFETNEFRSFYDKVSSERVRLNDDDQEYTLLYNGTLYTIAKGGIHSSEGKRILEPMGHEILRDADVGSQYPNAIVKRGLFPSHLGPEWLINFKKTIQLRLHYKGLSEDMSLSEAERQHYKGLAEMLKLALNGGGFGKTNDRSNWQYDPFVHFSCTIGNQFEMLMLIEKMEINGIRVVSANTDGIVCLFDKVLESKYNEVCKWWEKKVGNDVMGMLEFTDFRKLIQTSVNSYLAVKTNGKVKKKGKIFLTSSELNKNKSRRIIPIALEAYFMHGTPVEQTIRNHCNIFDFCVGVKASSDYHYELTDTKTGKSEVYNRVVRYFVSKNGGTLLKVKNENSTAKGNQITQCESGGWLTTVYNVAKEKDASKLNIDYDYYIGKVKEIINGMERPRRKKIKENPDQLNLF